MPFRCSIASGRGAFTSSKYGLRPTLDTGSSFGRAAIGGTLSACNSPRAAAGGCKGVYQDRSENQLSRARRLGGGMVRGPQVPEGTGPVAGLHSSEEKLNGIGHPPDEYQRKHTHQSHGEVGQPSLSRVPSTRTTPGNLTSSKLTGMSRAADPARLAA